MDNYSYFDGYKCGYREGFKDGMLHGLEMAQNWEPKPNTTVMMESSNTCPPNTTPMLELIPPSE